MAAGDPRWATPEPIVKALPVTLLDEPLEYIFADHLRQRGVCAALRYFSDLGQISVKDAAVISAYLHQDLALHHKDEDEDLFPSLRRRALPEDALSEPLKRLSKDHSRSDAVVEKLVAALRPADGNENIRPSPEIRELIAAYSIDEQRHLAIENGIVLAIARIRLTRADLKAMSNSMKKRRGVAA